MDEVRSHWQVASISHFCTLFGKPFKLPAFEPEELEQAFITDIPEIAEDSADEKSTNGEEIKVNSFPTDPPPMHLLVRLAIPLLRPHFNCKIRYVNIESCY